MKKSFLPRGLNSFVVFAGRHLKSTLILSSVLLYVVRLCFCIGAVQAQSIPTFKSSTLSGHTVAFKGDLSTLKTQIPYHEELRQINSLKQSYDSLKSKLKTLKEISKDTTRTDSALTMAKSSGKVVLDREKQILENMAAKEEIPDADLKAAIKNTLSDINRSGMTLEAAGGVADIAYLMDTSEENLKALTNEWVMPKIEQHLTGTLGQGWDPVPGRVPDYFSTGGLSLLETDGESAEEILTLARERAAGKARHISDEYLRHVDPDFRKLKIDTLGNIQFTRVPEIKQKPAFFEPNTLAGKNLSERTGLYVWYDPLTPFGEGVYIATGVSYGFSQHVRFFAGGVVSRHFSSAAWPKREGQGISLGMRVSKKNWALQANLTGSEATLTYPTGRDLLNYQGKILSSLIAVGRTVSMGSRIQSVVLVGVDPLYRKERSLSGSAVQIRLGFELENVSKPKREKQG